MKVKSFSDVQLFTTSWTVAYQAPMSMGSSRQEYWSGGAIAMNVGKFRNLATEEVTNKESVKWKIHVCILSGENGNHKN